MKYFDLYKQADSPYHRYYKRTQPKSRDMQERIALYNYIKKTHWATTPVFHGTSEKIWNLIKQRGYFTSPNLRGVGDREARTSGLDEVFFTTSLKYAEVYAKRAAEQDKSAPIIIGLEIPLHYFIEISNVILGEDLRNIYNEMNIQFHIDEIIKKDTSKQDKTNEILHFLDAYYKNQYDNEFTIKHAVPLRFVKTVKNLTTKQSETELHNKPLIEFEDFSLTYYIFLRQWADKILDSPLQYDKCPEEMKNHHEIQNARIDGWCKILTENPEDYDIQSSSDTQSSFAVPRDLLDNEKILNARKNGWIKLFKTSAANAEYILPDVLKNDKEILDAREEGWIKYFEKYPRLYQDECPKDLQSNTKIKNARLKGYNYNIRIGNFDNHFLSQNSQNFLDAIPSDLQNNNDILQAYKDRFIVKLAKNQIRFYSCPNMWRQDEDVIDAAKISLQHELMDNPRSYDKNYIPHKLLTDAGILYARELGWKRLLWTRGVDLSEIPEDLQNKKSIIQARQSGFIQDTVADMRNFDKIPVEYKNDIEFINNLIHQIIIKLYDNSMKPFEYLPEELADDKELQRALKEAWLRKMQPHIRNLEFLSAKYPSFLYKDDEFLQYLKKSWIGAIENNPDNYNICPKILRQDHDIIHARRNTWINLIKSGVVSLTYAPPDIQKDPEVVSYSSSNQKKTQANGWYCRIKIAETNNKHKTINDLNADKAYDAFKKSYEESVGTAWTKDKFISRSQNWRFYGDDNGYVTVREQNSGMLKLTGVAGNPKSILKGVKDLLTENAIIWGMVSKEIANMATRVGFQHVSPDVVKNYIHKIPSYVFGGAKINKVNDDGSVEFLYSDVGTATKYLIGNDQYISYINSSLSSLI